MAAELVTVGDKFLRFTLKLQSLCRKLDDAVVRQDFERGDIIPTENPSKILHSIDVIAKILFPPWDVLKKGILANILFPFKSYVKRRIFLKLSFCLKSNSAIHAFYQKNLKTHRTFKLKTYLLKLKLMIGF